MIVPNSLSWYLLFLKNFYNVSTFTSDLLSFLYFSTLAKVFSFVFSKDPTQFCWIVSVVSLVRYLVCLCPDLYCIFTSAGFQFSPFFSSSSKSSLLCLYTSWVFAFITAKFHLSTSHVSHEFDFLNSHCRLSREVSNLSFYFFFDHQAFLMSPSSHISVDFPEALLIFACSFIIKNAGQDFSLLKSVETVLVTLLEYIPCARENVPSVLGTVYCYLFVWRLGFMFVCWWVFLWGEDSVFYLGWEISIQLLSPFWSRMQFKSKISFTGFLSCSSLCQMEYWRPLVLLHSVLFFISTSTCLTCLESVMSNYVCMYVYGYICICLYMFLLGHLDKMVSSLSQWSTLSLVTAFDFVYFICCIVFVLFTWKDFHPFAFPLYATLHLKWIFFMRNVVGSPFWSFKIRFVSLAGQIPLHFEEFPLGHCAVFLLTCESSVIIPLLLFNFIVWWFFCCFMLKFSLLSHFCMYYHFLLCICHSLHKVL